MPPSNWLKKFGSTRDSKLQGCYLFFGGQYFLLFLFKLYTQKQESSGEVESKKEEM